MAVISCILLLWGCSQAREAPVHSRYQQTSRPASAVAADTLVAARVKAALKKYDLVDAKTVTVTVRRGTVHLTGTVKDRAEARMAAHLVRGISGVRRVENQLSFPSF